MKLVDRLLLRSSRPTSPVPPVATRGMAPRDVGPRDVGMREPSTRDLVRRAQAQRPSIQPLTNGSGLPSLSDDPMGADQSRQYALREVFTPTRPQRTARRLAGRQTELLRIFRAIALDRAHVVLYGERGRGKTSLVNLVASAARKSGYVVGRYTCSSDSKFDDIIRGLVRDLPRSMLASAVNDDDELEGCEGALPKGRLQPRDIVSLPGRLVGRHVVLIADEFDRVDDGVTRTMFADTIKQASDRGAALSFVIVGVSDSLEELLGRHPSIQRNIAGVPLPVLRNEDIDEILVHGGRDAGIEYAQPVRDAIGLVASGVPYIAQLLGLHSGTEALLRNSPKVEIRDLNAAFSRALEEVDPRVAAMYLSITDGERDRMMVAALRVLAGGEQDRFARFVMSDRARDRQPPERRIDAKTWSRLMDAGLIRACPSVGPDTYAFAEPMLQHYILMRGALERDAAA